MSDAPALLKWARPCDLGRSWDARSKVKANEPLSPSDDTGDVPGECKRCTWTISLTISPAVHWRFLGDGVDDVGFDAIDRGSKPVEDLALHLARQLGAHLINRPP